MILLYYYCILGFTNLDNITKCKKKYNSNIIIKDYSYNIFYYIYSIIIFILLIFSFIYDIIFNKELYIGYILYKLNFITQFIILYLKFNKIIEYKFYDSGQFYKVNLYSQLITLSLSILYIYKYNTNIIEYNYIIFIINLIDLIGALIYFNSLLIFILIFIKVLQEIYIIREKIINIINLIETKGLIELYYNIIKLKHNSSNYITNFNFIFNIFTIVNIIILGFIYEKKSKFELNNLEICDICIFTTFILIEIIILFIILYISKIRSDIYNDIFSNMFFEKFIKKYNILTFNDKYNIELDNNSNNIINIINDNSNSLDWIILYNTLNIKWMEFNLLGVEIQSVASISKLFLITSILYKLYN